jgi:Mg-chelatase subunit ChlD
MKGDKLSMCKRAGVALSFKAIEEKDLVGLIVFGKEIKQAVLPTDDFMMLLKEMIKLKAASETNLAVTLKQSIDMFKDPNSTKHLVILTDAMPTYGKDPETETLEAARLAANNGITVSIIGLDLNKKGEELAKKIVEIAKGRLYIVKDLKNVDQVVLEDYYSI